MSESKFKIGENVNFHGNTQVNQGDTVKARQNIETQKQFAEKKLETMVEKADDSQKQELEKLANEISAFFATRFDKLNEQQQKKVKELESSDWKGKVKFFVPVVKDLGLEISAEREIKPDEFANGVRKLLYGGEPVALNLLNTSS